MLGKNSMIGETREDQAMNTPSVFNMAGSMEERLTLSNQMVCMAPVKPEPSVSITILVLVGLTPVGGVAALIATVTHWLSVEVPLVYPVSKLSMSSLSPVVPFQALKSLMMSTLLAVASPEFHLNVSLSSKV